MRDKINRHPRLKHFLIGLISSHKNPRPRLWVRWLVNPFVHKKGRGAVVRSRRSRHDLFPWHRFDVGRGALVEDFTVLNNGAGDISIGAGARIGIGSVVIGPVRIGERAGLGQHVFIAGFNHGYADASCDSNGQPLVIREVVIGRESHIGANAVVVAGVHIGERVQVGAGSVVTKDLPSYCVAAGNPAHVVKRYDFRRRRWVRVDDRAATDGRPDGRDGGKGRNRGDARDTDSPSNYGIAAAQPGGKSDRRQPRGGEPKNTPAAQPSRSDAASGRAAQPQNPKNDGKRTPDAGTGQDARGRQDVAARPQNPKNDGGRTSDAGTGQDARGRQEVAARPARPRRNRRKPASDSPGRQSVNGGGSRSAAEAQEHPAPSDTAPRPGRAQNTPPETGGGQNTPETSPVSAADRLSQRRGQDAADNAADTPTAAPVGNRGDGRVERLEQTQNTTADKAAGQHAADITAGTDETRE